MHIPKQIQIGMGNFDDHCQCPEIQFGLEKSIANTLNQFQFYFVKSHFRKGKHSNIQIQDQLITMSKFL